jgi:hypothetical protein
MARIYRAHPDGDVPASERKVFDRLRQLPDSWLVIHARRFLLPATAGREPIEGKSTFSFSIPTAVTLASIFFCSARLRLGIVRPLLGPDEWSETQNDECQRRNNWELQNHFLTPLISVS